MTNTYTIEVEYLTACPVCADKNISLAHKAMYGDYELHYSRCAACGLLFLNPRMSDAQTDTYYRGMYRDILGGEDGIKAETINVQQARAGMQYAIMGEYLEKAERQNNLEIGCSAGYLMHTLAVELNIQSWGIEPDERYHKLEPASGFPVYASLDDLPPMRFDLISMSHVLEHINHPLNYIKHLLETRATDDTLFLVEVPDAELTQQAFLIHHPIAFTQATLDGLFGQVGYKPVARFWHGLTKRVPMFYLALYGRGN